MILQNRGNATVLPVLLLALGIFLAACTTGTPAPAAPQPSPSPVVSSTPAITPTTAATPNTTPTVSLGLRASDLAGIEIEFWHPWKGELDALVQRFADEFNQSNPYGITVRPVSQDNLTRQVQDALRAGQPPELTVHLINQAQLWDQGGQAVVDLTPYFLDADFGLGEALADFYPAFLAQENAGGKQYGLPAYRSTRVLFYNQTWARELGFETAPATAQEFQQQACAAAQANNTDADTDNDGTGGWMISTHPTTILSWMFAFGGEVVSPAGNYVFETPESIAAFEFLRTLADQGCAWFPDSEFPHDEFAGRLGLFAAFSLSRADEQAQAFARAENPDGWTAIPFPAAEGDPVVAVSGPAYVILNTTPEEQLAAWLFAKWLSRPEIQARWVAATGFFPTRQSVLPLLSDYAAEHPQWAAIQPLTPDGRPEPQRPSWVFVRWLLSDAASELFGFGFTLEGVPNLVEMLDASAQEVDGLNR